MDSHTDLQTRVQSPPQEQTQPISPYSDGRSPATIPEDTSDIDAWALKKQLRKDLCALSKTFGDIPGVPIFTQWKTRQACCNDAVHRATQAGICGNQEDGAFSVVMSGVYEDVDEGDVIIYTGTGGGHTGHPTKPTWDQSWDWAQNKALIVSSHTGKPVRVIRSSECGSKYAPYEGFRYDGLYTVSAPRIDKGRDGYDLCRCRLERLPHQPPIPLRLT